MKTRILSAFLAALMLLGALAAAPGAAIAGAAGHVHALIRLDAVKPTCTEPGSIEHWVCAGCGQLFLTASASHAVSANEVSVPALGHFYGDWTVITPATCTEPGFGTRKCERCGEVMTSVSGKVQTEYPNTAPRGQKLSFTAPYLSVPAGTAEVTFDLRMTNVDPRLGVGSIRATVKVEGARIKSVDQADLVGDGVGKFFVVGDMSDSVTFMWADDADGWFAPAANAATITVELPENAAPGDRFDIDVVTSQDQWNYLSYSDSSSTITALGAYAVDGDIEITEPVDPDKTIPALGHDFAAAVTPATCTEAGYVTFTCDRCGMTYTTENGRPAGHKWSTWKVMVPATEDEKGVKARVCEVCGATETRAIPRPGDPDDSLEPDDTDVPFDPGVNDVIPGDFNGDFRVNAKDVVALMKAIISGTAESNAAADFNGDGKVNAKDVVALMKAIVRAR